MSGLPIPGVFMGPCPERRELREGAITRLARLARAALPDLGRSRLDQHQRFVAAVSACHEQAAALTAEERRKCLDRLRATLAHDGFTERGIAQAFALVKHACAVHLGIELYDTQLIAARVMLDNRLAEMATGEGKTVAAAVCAATAALAGVPVHVITANDYLVARDAQSLEPLYAALGLSVGCVTRELDAAARCDAYACDITYCTAKELVFDYLRDGRARGRFRTELHRRAQQLAAEEAVAPALLRGLCMAIVDEADTTLIDEARIPLVLSESRGGTAAEDCYRRALSLAGALHPVRHFSLDRDRRSAELTAEGRSAIAQRAQGLAGVWRTGRQRDEAVCTALAALHLYHRDRDYLVHDGAVSIIDETTGRAAPGRVWARGLHQLIECKEGCGISSELVTVAQITYQRFFRRYLRLCGMSGTLSEASAELSSVYGLQVVKVPLRRPCLRRELPTRIHPDTDALWQAVVARAAELSRSGRPILIGTDSVADSEALSRRFAQAGLPHALLNARHDRREAQIIARAGRAGHITVATNMAGRGTDIPLSPEAAQRGGLHVVCCQNNPSRRIDRQLVGRCARGGDPGSTEVLISLNKLRIPVLFRGLIRRAIGDDRIVRPAWLIPLVLRLPQWIEEGRQRRQRRQLLEQDLLAESHPLIGSSGE